MNIIPRAIPENLNLEGMSSAIRIAMLPYAPKGTKINLTQFALQLDPPSKIAGLVRKISNSSHLQMIVIKRVVRIMLDLFPLKFSEETQKVDEKDPLTKIYRLVVIGLKHFNALYFEKINTYAHKIDEHDVSQFDYQDSNDYSVLSEATAAEALRRGIAILEYSLLKRIAPKNQLEPLELKVSQTYDEDFFSLIVNSFNFLEKNFQKNPEACSHFFHSLTHLTEAALEMYKKNRDDLSTLKTAK